MPATCALENGGSRYVVRHNPWTYFVDDRAACEQFDVPADRLSSAVEGGGLPTVGMVIPDLITADEDDHSQDNLVLTTVVNPSLRHVVVDQPLSHLSLSPFLSEVAHQPPLAMPRRRHPRGEAFHLQVGG